MKINKEILKQIILEELEEQEQQPPGVPQTMRQKKVAAATTSGATMKPDEYLATLKQVLLTPKVTNQVRLAALEQLFPGKGASVNSLVLQMLKQAQQGAQE